MVNLYSPDVATSVVDNLISGTLVPCKVWPKNLAITDTAITALKRGTVLGSNNGVNYDDVDITAAPTGNLRYAILANDVDVTDPNLGAVAVYMSGEFNQNRIEEAMGADMNPALVNLMSAQQLYVAPMSPAPEVF
jgi:hypothetical protein